MYLILDIHKTLNTTTTSTTRTVNNQDENDGVQYALMLCYGTTVACGLVDGPT